MPTNDNPNQVKISVPTEVEDGVYSNFAVITHSSAEFILDFIRMLPNGGSPKVKSRVVMAPEHAKRLMYALNLRLCCSVRYAAPWVRWCACGAVLSAPRARVHYYIICRGS